MEISCNQDTFAKYLSIVSRIVGNKPGFPILNNVFFESGNGRLVMTATDLEVGVHCWIGANIKSDGKTTVPAKQLSEFVNSVPSKKIDVKLEKQILMVNAGKSVAQFNTLDSGDFPTITSDVKGKPLVKMDKENLLRTVRSVAFSAAKDDTKPVFTGVRIEVEDKTIAFVTADGLRLSRYFIKLDASVKEKVNFLVPVKAFEELARIVGEFPDNNDDIEIYLLKDKNEVLFRYNDIDLVTRLIDGKFPDYKAIIPTSHEIEATFDKDEFEKSIKVVDIIARSVLGNRTVLKFNKEKGEITVFASQSELGSNRSTLGAKIEGKSMEIAFSSRFISDFLNNMEGETIVFQSFSPTSTAVFKIKGNDAYIHLIMPMRQ